MTIPPILAESTRANPLVKPPPQKPIVQAMRENLAALREQGATPEEIEFEILRWGNKIKNANDWEMYRAEIADSVAPSIASALDAGTFGLAGIATDALSPGDFQTNRDARQSVYQAMPTTDRVLSSLAGGLANPVSRLTGTPAAGGGYLAAAGRGALEGAAQGALTGFGENVGTTGGAGAATLIGGAAGGVAGGVLSPLARALSSGVGGAASSNLDAMALTPSRPERDALRRALQAQEADAGPVAPAAQAPMRSFELFRETPQRTPVRPTRPDFPAPMAVDEAGPTMVANARGATGTVPGREGFRGPFEQRSAAMPEAVTRGTPDAVAIGNQLEAKRSAVGQESFGAAIESTKGNIVDSDLISDILTTPMGQKAWKAVSERRPNRVVGTGDPARALPTVEKFDGPNLVDAPVPDAEAIHEIKRQLSEWAKLNPEVAAASGVDAIGAQDALGLFTRLQSEMPAPFRAADAAYAEASRPIDALTMGRQPWKSNPNPGAFKSEKLAVTNALDRYGAMTPDEQVMVRTGKQYDLASRIRDGKLSLADAVRQMDTPQSAVGEEFRIGGGPMPERIRAWEPAMARQNQVLPSGQLSIEPTVNTPGAVLSENAAPTMLWTGVKAARNLFGKASRGNLAERGAEDAAFANLMTGRPETLADALANLSLRDDRLMRTQTKAASTTGRTAGGSR